MIDKTSFLSDDWAKGLSVPRYHIHVACHSQSFVSEAQMDGHVIKLNKRHETALGVVIFPDAPADIVLTLAKIHVVQHPRFVKLFVKEPPFGDGPTPVAGRRAVGGPPSQGRFRRRGRRGGAHTTSWGGRGTQYPRRACCGVMATHPFGVIATHTYIPYSGARPSPISDPVKLIFVSRSTAA